MNDRFDSSDLVPFDNSGHHSGFGQSLKNVQPGTLLVASPSLMNTPFEKAVVLVLQNGEDGTYGVVLNRPANEQIRSAWLQLSGGSEGVQSIVHGGPIGGPVFALHREAALAELEVPGGVFLSSDSATVQELVRHPELDYRIVFGVAGWQSGQLNHEVESGHWFQLDGDAEQVFDDPDWMWEKSLRRYGNQVLCQVVGLSGLPASPLLN